ncbi:hypothetical protein [Sulfitobacter sp. MF3-043]|uniref:hypothetical protein n=1 Tax=Sulfitobacter sediminivivens TaxID=3252902 RepID=UPI0036D88AFA
MLSNGTPIFQFSRPFGIPVQVGGSIISLALIFVSFSGGSTGLMCDLTFVGLLIGSIFLHALGPAWGRP